MKLRDALLLGRVSNLPTVWTNVLAGAALSGATIDLPTLSLALIALSFFYCGGMYLNDAFDRDFDRVARPERPIPSGRVDASSVFLAGSGMLLAGIVLLGIAGGSRAALGGIALSTVIVWYDAHHKTNRLSPVLMALCRAGVYACSALAFERDICPGVLKGAALLSAYVIALTYLAKHGARPTTVVRMIAAITLLDAMWIWSRGEVGYAVAAIGAYALTRVLQRIVPGT